MSILLTTENANLAHVKCTMNICHLNQLMQVASLPVVYRVSTMRGVALI